MSGMDRIFINVAGKAAAEKAAEVSEEKARGGGVGGAQSAMTYGWGPVGKKELSKASELRGKLVGKRSYRK